MWLCLSSPSVVSPSTAQHSTMDAAVSLSLSLSLPLHHHVHGAHPLPLPAPHHHHHHNHCAANAPSSKAHAQAPPSARLSLAVAARPLSPSSPAPAAPAQAPPATRSSSRAATGYAAALADACARAGTLRRAARHARKLLVLRPGRLEVDAAAVVEQMDARVAALVRMLVAKGKTGMVAEALAEFAAICDHLLPHQPPRARHAY